MGVVLLSGRLAQNFVLLHYEAGVEELAVYALALAVFGPFRAALTFVPQMTTVVVRGPRSLRDSLRFVVVISLILTAPLALLAWTPLGAKLLPLIYDVSPDRIDRMLLYMRWFTPLVLFQGLSRYGVGLLVQARRTGTVTALRALELGLLVGTLVLGMSLGWHPVLTISMSLVLPRLVHMALAGTLAAVFHHHREPEEDRPLELRELLAFFLPMAGTSLLFSLTRPIIYGFITSLNPAGDPSLPNVDSMVAAVTLASTFTMIFQGAINQFRHLLTTYGTDDLPGVRRFMLRTTAIVTGLMVLTVASPLAGLFFRHLQGATGNTLEMARQAVWVCCLVPVVICWRNYYHGQAMVHQRTGGMLAGGVMRNASVAVAAACLTAGGLYNHITAAAMLPLAFGSEAATVMLFTRSWRRSVVGVKQKQGLDAEPACD